MTKKDFEAIARALKDQHDALAPLTAAQERILLSTAKDIAGVCAAQNPRFDRARFLAACGFPQ